MLSVWLENGELSLRDVPVPIPPDGEALVRVLAAGICSTDLELVKGYYPYRGILGHEFVGEVVSLNGQAAGLVGQRVVGEINAYCHNCSTCLRGDLSHCENRTVLGIVNRNGAFAPYLTLPLENLHRVPDSVSNVAAVFTEPLAAALEILEQVEVTESDRVLVIGAGRLGQLIARVLSKTGCRLGVAAKYHSQREMLAGAELHAVDPEDIRPGGYDIVVEATGSRAGFKGALSAVRPRGKIVLKSTYAGEITANLSEVVVNEITLIGSRCGPFATALNWLETKTIDPEVLVHARYPLKDGLQALSHAAEPGVLKVLLEIGTI